MIPRRICGRVAVVCGVIVTTLSGGAFAQSVDSILNAENRRVNANNAAQVRIDNIVQETRELVNDYRGVTKEIDGLRIYNRLMVAQTEKQQTRLDELALSMEQANVINRQIFPLMERMIEGIDKFVKLDVPFLMQERTDRINILKDLMDQPNVTVAEKFRKVMEAYQIENDYGRTIESYKGKHPEDDREVSYLRIGRVALLYQTADGSDTGRWNGTGWEDAGDHRNEVKKGLDVATQKIAPELLLLPVATPEAN